MPDLDSIFVQIKQVLENNSEGMTTKSEYLDSQAKTKKPGYHLYGPKEVRIAGRKPQLTYIAGVIQQKNYVSFYFSPVYSHPDDFKEIDPNLRSFLKGKSCFNINKIDEKVVSEIDKTLKSGIKKYSELGWI